MTFGTAQQMEEMGGRYWWVFAAGLFVCNSETVLWPGVMPNPTYGGTMEPEGHGNYS